MNAALLAVCLFAAAPGGAPVADFSGRWTIDEKASGDLFAAIDAGAGQGQLRGSTLVGNVPTLFPRSSTRTSTERMELREFLRGQVVALRELEIEQSAVELKTIHDGDGVRIFRFDRPSAGGTAAGTRVVRRTRWHEGQLVLESVGEKSKLIEMLTPLPQRDQLIYVIRLEMDLLEAPVELRLIYTRQPTPQP